VDWRAGRVLGRVFRTPNGKVEARLTGEGAFLLTIGPRASDVAVSWDDLALLASAFERWKAIRDAWAGYFRACCAAGQAATTHRHPPGPTPPGWTPGPGNVFYAMGIYRFDHGGARELRPLPTPRALASGWEAVADLWRCEPRIGPKGGELVGERWLLDGRLIVDVRRFEARSYHGDDCFVWRADEADVPAEFLALRPTITGEACR
jgi:hypothetical protein